jgi:RNA polymerase sigma-70 factor (ECF subfamily)
MMVATSAAAAVWAFRPWRERLRLPGMNLLTTATDSELAACIRRGESDAIAVLVERYTPRLYRYLVRFLGSSETDRNALAEDILQDTWLRVMERIDHYDPRQPFGVWLFAIARHRAIDLLRQQARQVRHLGSQSRVWENEEGELYDPVENLPASSPSVLEELAEADLSERVAGLFDSLPVHYREVLTLRFHEDLELQEIARLLRVPLSTVKTRVQRGLVLLRRRAEGTGLANHG